MIDYNNKHQWSKAKHCNFIDVSENLDSLHNGGGSGWRAGESWENHYTLQSADREAGPLAPPTPTRPSFKFASHHGGGGHAHCTTAAASRHHKHPPPRHVNRRENVIITNSGQFRRKLLPQSTVCDWPPTCLHPPLPVISDEKSCWQSHPLPPHSGPD